MTQGEREVWASGGREPPISGGGEPTDFYEKPSHSVLSPGPLLIDGFGGREPLKPGKERGKGDRESPEYPRLVGRRRRVSGRSVVAKLTRYRLDRVSHVGRLGGREPPKPPKGEGDREPPGNPHFVGQRRRVLGRSAVAELTRYRHERDRLQISTDWAGSLRSQFHCRALRRQGATGVAQGKGRQGHPKYPRFVSRRRRVWETCRREN